MSLLQANTITLDHLLPVRLMDELRMLGRITHYFDKQLIQQRGDQNVGISILESGQAVAGNVGADGVFLTSTLLGPGECFGEFTLFAQLPRTHDLWALGETAIFHIKGADFLEIFDREPVIARALLTITLRRNHELLEFVDAQRRLPLNVRTIKNIARINHGNH